MRFFAAIRIAFRALLRNKMRAVLTMLGVIFGVGAVITTVSLGDGAKFMVQQQIATMGENVMLIFAGNFSRGGVSFGSGSSSTLTLEDMEAIRREVPGVRNISPEVRTSRQVIAGGLNTSTSIIGASPDYFAIRSWTIKDGSFFSEPDITTASKVAVIGKTTAQTLFEGNDPVGQVVRVSMGGGSTGGSIPFTIIGVLNPKGSSPGSNTDYDDCLIIPYTTAMKRLLNSPTLRGINVQTETMEMMPEVQQRIADLLRQTHRITAGRPDDFTIRSQEELASAMSATQETMQYLLGGVAIVSLLVGGIGIMNIMLVSVTERTREIGIRMALGARPRDVLAQFLIEAITLSCTGGVLGIILGMVASKVLTQLKSWPTLTSPDAILYSFAFSAAVGIFFGFYPARKAAQLDPIDALRYE
ncbi:MAG: multidrug transporter substrate-binding protein [Verrucomicrobia bacterium]|jgi:putative ABC transport system permease protein|nr:multidrug transporter substrate-binding protein [Verrucomicrobiota bacterium]